MRMIGTLPDAAAARRFGDFLTSQAIDSQVEQAGPQGGPETGAAWQVWILNDDHLERASRELAAFTAAPSDPRFVAAAPVARAVRETKEKQARRLRKNFIDVRTHWGKTGQSFAPITLVLIAASCIVTFVTGFGKDQMMVARLLLYRFPYGWYQLTHGQLWRLITPIFPHMSIMHLLFNMWWMWDLGTGLERRKGSWWFGAFVLAATVLTTTAQSFDESGAGMSGVVYALIGYVWVAGKVRPAEGIALSNENAIIAIVWLGLGFTGMLGPIGNIAHLSGLIIGAVVAYSPTGWLRLRRMIRGG